MFLILTAGGSVLVVLSVASFWPQLDRIWHYPRVDTMSAIWLFLNLLSMTDQFGLQVFIVFLASECPGECRKSPITLGEWLDLAQFGLIWLCQALL